MLAIRSASTGIKRIKMESLINAIIGVMIGHPRIMDYDTPAMFGNPLEALDNAFDDYACDNDWTDWNGNRCYHYEVN